MIEKLKAADAAPQIGSPSQTPAKPTKLGFEPSFFVQPADERSLQATKPLGSDLESRVQALWNGRDAYDPDEMQTKVAECRQEAETIVKKIETLEFSAAYPLVEELDPAREGSFANNIYECAENTRRGGWTGTN